MLSLHSEILFFHVTPGSGGLGKETRGQARSEGLMAPAWDGRQPLSIGAMPAVRGTWSLQDEIERGIDLCLLEGLSQGFTNASFVNKP